MAWLSYWFTLHPRVYRAMRMGSLLRSRKTPFLFPAGSGIMAGYLGGLQAILFYCTTSRSVPQACFFTGVYYVSFLFLLHIARMRYISRWGLMRNTDPENVQEHSHMVAVLAHALAVIRRDKFGGTIDPVTWPPWRCTTTPRRSSPGTFLPR